MATCVKKTETLAPVEQKISSDKPAESNNVSSPVVTPLLKTLKIVLKRKKKIQSSKS